MDELLQPLIRPERHPIWGALGPVLLLGSYFFLGLLLYLVRRLRHGRFEDAEINTRGKTAIIGMAPRHYFAWVMSPLWKGLARLQVPANAITTLSVLIAMASGTALAAGHFALGGWLYIFAGACDFIDGRLARASGRTSPAGAAFDSVLDRYAESAVFIGLAWFFRDSWALLLVLLALSGSHLVPYVRARGEGLGVEVKVGTMQRPERLVIIGLTAAFSPLVEALWAPVDGLPAHRLAVLGVAVLAFTTPLTALARLFHVMKVLDPNQSNLLERPAGVGGLGRNLISAVVATGADFALVFVLVRELQVAPWSSTLLGCVLGGLVNFLINRVWAFESRAPALGQAARYTFVSGSNALINAGGVGALMLLPGFDPLWAWWLVRGLTFLTWSYPLHRDYVYVKAPPAQTFAGATLVLLLLGGTAEANPVLRPNLLPDEAFAETFSFFVDAEDGTYAHVQLGISNVGPGSKKGGCRAMIARPGRPTYVRSKVVEAAAWRHEAEDDRLVVGDCEARRGETLLVTARHGAERVRIELRADAARTRAPALSFGTKGGFFESEVLVPSAPASLEIVHEGERHRSEGHGYADHSRSKAMPREVAKTWVRFRKVSAEAPVLVLVREAPSGSHEGWLRRPSAGGSGSERSIARFQLQGGESKGQERAFRIMLDAEGGPWRITSRQLLYRQAPIEEQGVLGKMVSPVVGNPVTYVYRAVLEERGSKDKHEGILEVSFSDDKRTP